ncbi:MAG: hypothetical protein ACFCGT_09180 [Sandaracinaceae bacterium]
MLQASGLTIEHASYYNTLLFPLVVAKRMAERLVGSSVPRSDLSLPPAPINTPLGKVLSVERHLVPHVRLPFGVSCFAMARRPDDAGAATRPRGRPGGDAVAQASPSQPR